MRITVRKACSTKSRAGFSHSLVYFSSYTIDGVAHLPLVWLLLWASGSVSSLSLGCQFPRPSCLLYWSTNLDLSVKLWAGQCVVLGAIVMNIGLIQKGLSCLWCFPSKNVTSPSTCLFVLYLNGFRFSLFFFFLYLFIICVYVQHVFESQRTICRSQFSPSTM